MSSIFTPELTAALVAHNRLYDVKEFAKAADALLAEGLALLRAHAGEGDVINRYVATVEKVRAQYRAAKEAPAPAPEPSAPPAGVPMCKAWCGTDNTAPSVPSSHWCGTGNPGTAYCSSACADDGVPLNPPPSRPVTVATGGTVSAHPAPFAHDCDIVPGDEIPTAEECAETVKRLGIDVPAWAAEIRARVAAVASGGVPVDLRDAAESFMRSHFEWHLDGDGCEDDDDMEYATDDLAQLLERTARAALVPIDTARPGPVLPEGEPVLFTCPHGLTRSEPGCGAMCNLKPGSLWTGPHSDASDVSVKVDPGVTADDVRAAVAAQADRVSAFSGKPPGPVSVEAPRCNCMAPSDEPHDLDCPARPRVASPAAPASEPAVRPLSERIGARFVDVSNADGYAGCLFADEVAALEAEFAEEKAAHDMTRDAVKVAVDCENAARAEVERLRGKLAEATARVRSMREAAAKAMEDRYGEDCDSARIIRAIPLDTATATAPMPPCYYGGHWCEHKRTQDLGTALVCLDCGKQQGRSGEVLAGSPGWTGQAMAPLLRPAQDAIDQADAIKAAVADERKRCLAWVNERDVLSREDWLTGIESGEDAPGAVTPAKGTP